MSNSEIEALRKAGRYAEAANLCLQAGDAERASELYATVWDWPNAIQTAEQAGLFALAYRHTLASGDRQAIERLLAVLPDHPDQALAAAAAAEGKGRVVDAARLREAAGAVEDAARLFERAGELFDAARCHESAGNYRKAGKLYERRVKEDPTDGEAALRLGRILAHFGRYDHAARSLQIAEQDRERKNAALRLMIACFDALKMHDAAASCLERLRLIDPRVPMRVTELLEEEYGDARGLAGLAKGEKTSQLLAGRYRIVKPLGAGTTGRVLLAHDGFYDRDVAVKLLSVGAGAQGRDAYARFAREARVAAGLEHPNVIHVFEFNPDGPFLVMEFMEGGTLQDRLDAAERPLPLDTVRHVALAVLRGLEAVHRRGVIHRDLKPANVFFGSAGDVKIGDFGVAHLQDLGATLTGAMLGTLAYMAPEQITGSARPEATTDLYAFGCMLHQLLSGELPFPGPDFLTQHLERVPPKLSALRPALGDRFDALLEQLLMKEMGQRPRSVEEVRRTIETIDWRDPDENELQRLIEMERVKPTAPRPPSIPPPAASDRYTMVESREGGAYLARDEVLERFVVMEACNEARAKHLEELSAADNPYLQAIFDIDREMERAVIEAPRGELLSQTALSARGRARMRGQIIEALKRIHAVGLVHGDVRMGTVRVGPGRAVLLLPLTRHEGTAEADLEAASNL